VNGIQTVVESKAVTLKVQPQCDIDDIFTVLSELPSLDKNEKANDFKMVKETPVLLIQETTD
jgi:hypothetical protein